MSIELSNPLPKVDREVLAKDEPLFRSEPVSRKFLRRRVVFFMDGYRYAVQAVKRRWGIDFVFFEAGREQLKSVYLPDSLDVKGAELWWKMMDEDRAFAKNLTKELYRMVGEAKRLARNIPRRGITPDKAQEALRAHLEYWVKLFEIGFLWFAAEKIKEKVDAEARAVWRGDAGECERFLSAVYRPIRLPLSSREQRDLLALHPLQGEERERALKRHWKKYRHLALHNVDDEPFDLEYYRGRLHALENAQEYTTQKGQLDRADAEMVESDRLLKEAKLPRKLKDRITFVRWFMYLRTENIDHMMLVNGALQPVFRFVAKTHKLPVEAALHMTYLELISSLESGSLTVAREDLLDGVKNGYAYLIAPHGSFLVSGNEIEELQRIVLPVISHAEVRELKGQTAFQGRVSAKVRVIVDRRNAKELLPGEILVTAMTSPDFVPAMRISSGIITNEGGVLCHAAIMSRELRKPCVIGTKNATEVLKTGDEVELDAAKGIVTILKRA